jgi:hypothetical protein
MANEKTVGISQTKHVMYTIGIKNRIILAFYERLLMRERGIKDCIDIPNSDIINRALVDGYKYRRVKREM